MNPGIFDRELDAADRERWRDELAHSPIDDNHATRISLLGFRCGGEHFAWDPGIIEGVSTMPACHSLPGSAAGIAGLVNARGNVLLCFALAEILNCGTDSGDQAMLLIVRHDGWRVAVQVDAVIDMIAIGDSQLTNLPSTLRGAARAHSKGFAKRAGRAFAVLDVEKVFETFKRVAAACRTT